MIYLFFQLNLNNPSSVTATSKNNKPKKLNSRRHTKKSPLQTTRQQIVDDQTGPLLTSETRTTALETALAIPGSSSRDPHGQSTQTTISQSTPTSPTTINANEKIPPPPNATVVVCVLAGTGLADLWVRNNRGQTPLDLCPADQPLRRALIKCCDAAARARSAQAAASATTRTETSRPLPISEQWPQQSQLLLNNMPPDHSLKSPYHKAYTSAITANPGPSKECFKPETPSGSTNVLDSRLSHNNNSLGSVPPLTLNSFCQNSLLTSNIVLDASTSILPTSTISHSASSMDLGGTSNYVNLQNNNDNNSKHNDHSNFMNIMCNNNNRYMTHFSSTSCST